MVAPLPCCADCRDRDAVIAHLHQRIAQLEADKHRLLEEVQRLRQQLDETRREQGRQAGRFRRRQLKKRRKRPGRKPGHVAAHRPLPTPDQIDRVLHVPCRTCPECRTPLCDPKVLVQYQTDLPPIVPIVTQFNIEAGYCPCCRLHRQGRHPLQISAATAAAGNTLGPVVLTLAAELKHRLGVPYRKICDFLSTYCAFAVCPAAFVRAEQRLTDRAEPTYQLLCEALRQAQVVHADETGWRVGRVNAWLWVFSSQEVTIYAIRHSRGSAVPLEFLGPDFDGWLIVDGLKTYDVLNVAKSRCHGHLLRRCKELADVVPAPEQQHIAALATLVQGAIDLAQGRDQLTAGYYARQAEHYQDALDD